MNAHGSIVLSAHARWVVLDDDDILEYNVSFIHARLFFFQSIAWKCCFALYCDTCQYSAVANTFANTFK